MLPDGVYIDLDFEEYREDDALGSTHKATLWLRGEGYWWRYHAPYQPKQEQTPEKLFGSAAHAMLLEGVHAYESRYIVKPSKEDYPGALFTVDAIKAALRAEKVPLHGTSHWTKEDWCDAAETYLPDVPVWDNIMAEFTRRHNGREVISAFDDFAIRAFRELAVREGEINAEMRELFSVGSEFPILAEVSIIYTDADGIRHRARLDKLLPVVTGDMKTFGEWSGRPPAQVLDTLIKRSGYDVQEADYQVARQAMNRMLLTDPARYLHGGTREQRDHLVAMAQWNQTNRWGWLWIFFQKPTHGGNAPILFPLRDPWKGPYHMAGFRKRHAGLELYKRCMREFGLDKPWGKVEPIHYVDEGAEHHIPVDQWDWGPDDPAPNEEDHFQTPDYEPRRIITKGDYLA